MGRLAWQKNPGCRPELDAALLEHQLVDFQMADL